MPKLSLRPLAVAAAALVLGGLGLLGAFLLPSSDAHATAGSLTYPTFTKPTTTRTTTHATTTQATEPETTAEVPTTAAATTTAATTTAPETTTTTTADPTAGGTLPSSSRSSRQVKAAHNGTLGANIVVDQNGMTLYHLITERSHRLLCTGPCTRVWPPLVVPRGAKPLAGKGVSARRLGTIRRADGQLQWTYAGLPLYRYSRDRKPGNANGQGAGKMWYAVGLSGQIIRSAPTGGYGR